MKSEFRGLDYGYHLWKTAMQRLQGRNVGLNGVVEQQPNYCKSGFQLAYRNIRQQGFTGDSIPQDSMLVNLQNFNFPDIEAYDRKFPQLSAITSYKDGCNNHKVRSIVIETKTIGRLWHDSLLLRRLQNLATFC
ncbi:MAG: hypothetical protein SVM86_05025 [Candidatus Cloacimonadota bacterium]|nr:hypothetical protein [Candidatus Cloacimonadota bacterium]